MSDGLWDYALRLYALPGVSPACLALQDGHGADVNQLLFALWAAQQGRAVGDAELTTAEHVTRVWRETVIVPLRTARRALKSPGAAYDAASVAVMREGVKRAELESERLQLEALAASVPLDNPARRGAELARANLAACMARLSPPPDPALPEALIGAWTSLS